MEERKILTVQKYQKGQVWMVKENPKVTDAKMTTDCRLMAKNRPYVIVSSNEFLSTNPEFIQGYPMSTQIHDENGAAGPYITIQNMVGSLTQIVMRELKTIPVSDIQNYFFSIPEAVMEEVDMHTAYKLGMLYMSKDVMCQLSNLRETLGKMTYSTSMPAPKLIGSQYQIPESKNHLTEKEPVTETGIRIPKDINQIPSSVVADVITNLEPTEWKYFQKNAVTQLMESNKSHIVYQRGYCKSGKPAGAIEVIYYDHNAKNKAEPPKFIFPYAFVRVAVTKEFRKSGIARMMLSDMFSAMIADESFHDLKLQMFYNPDICTFSKFAPKFGFSPDTVKIDRCQLFKFTGTMSNYVVENKPKPVERKAPTVRKQTGVVHTLYSTGSTTPPKTSVRMKWTPELMESFLSDCKSMSKESVAIKWNITVKAIDSRKNYCRTHLQNAIKQGGVLTQAEWVSNLIKPALAHM